MEQEEKRGSVFMDFVNDYARVVRSEAIREFSFMPDDQMCIRDRVKSIRMGKCSVKEAFVKIDKGQVYIYGMHILSLIHI